MPPTDETPGVVDVDELDADVRVAPASPPLAGGRFIPLVIGSALFVQVLDATVITTALPSMARALGRDPVSLNAAITAYLVGVAAFLPLAGWVADRFGAKRVFQAAIVGFALSSLACGLSQTLPELILSRLAQGVAGSFMTPVGRLVLLRSAARGDLVRAMAWLSMPALLGPILGPPLGGFIVTFASWRWIFFLNLPMAAAALALNQRFLPRAPPMPVPRLDGVGFLLSGLGLGGLIYGLSNAEHTGLAAGVDGLVLGGGLIALLLYGLHARTAANPVVDLGLLKVPSFRAALLGGLFGRLINGANPFLLALLLQLGFGLSAFQAGLLILANAGGAVLMRPIAPRIIRRFGFRRVLIVNAVLASSIFAAYALFRPSTPHAVIVLALLAGGFFRSLQFTALNGLAYTDIPGPALSRASTFWSVAHQMAQGLGIGLSAMLVQAFRHGAAGVLDWRAIAPAFLIVAGVSLFSLAFFAPIARDSGQSVSFAAGG